MSMSPALLPFLWDRGIAPSLHCLDYSRATCTLSRALSSSLTWTRISRPHWLPFRDLFCSVEACGSFSDKIISIDRLGAVSSTWSFQQMLVLFPFPPFPGFSDLTSNSSLGLLIYDSKEQGFHRSKSEWVHWFIHVTPCLLNLVPVLLAVNLGLLHSFSSKNG